MKRYPCDSTVSTRQAGPFYQLHACLVKPHQITHDRQYRAEVVVGRVAPEKINRKSSQKDYGSSGTACRCCATGNGREQGRTRRARESDTDSHHKKVKFIQVHHPSMSGNPLVHRPCSHAWSRLYSQVRAHNHCARRGATPDAPEGNKRWTFERRTPGKYGGVPTTTRKGGGDGGSIAIGGGSKTTVDQAVQPLERACSPPLWVIGVT